MNKTPETKTPTRAEALAALKMIFDIFESHCENMDIDMPDDEDAALLEGCKAEIEAALATDAPIVEGVDKAIKKVEAHFRDEDGTVYGWVKPVTDAARLYAQGRTQSEPECDAPERYWLIEQPDLEDDDDYKRIHTTDLDVYPDAKVLGEYVLKQVSPSVDIEKVVALLEPLREVEMEVVGCAMECCGNVTDGGECRSYCVVQGEPEYEPRLVDGPINQALFLLFAAPPVTGGARVDSLQRELADYKKLVSEDDHSMTIVAKENMEKLRDLLSKIRHEVDERECQWFWRRSWINKYTREALALLPTPPSSQTRGG